MTSENHLKKAYLDVVSHVIFARAIGIYLLTAIWTCASYTLAYGAEFHSARLDSQFRNSHATFDDIKSVMSVITHDPQHDHGLDISALEKEAHQMIEGLQGSLSSDTPPPFEDQHNHKALFESAEEFYILSIAVSEFDGLTHGLIARDDVSVLGLSLDVIDNKGALSPFITEDGFHILWPKTDFDLSLREAFISDVHGYLWQGKDGRLNIAQREDIHGHLALSFSDKTAQLQFFSQYGSSILRFSFDDLSKTGISSSTGDLFINETSRKTDIQLGIIGQDELDAILQFKTWPQNDKESFAGFVTSLPK